MVKEKINRVIVDLCRTAAILHSRARRDAKIMKTNGVMKLTRAGALSSRIRTLAAALAGIEKSTSGYRIGSANAKRGKSAGRLDKAGR